jgi:hypothetical protein
MNFEWDANYTPATLLFTGGAALPYADAAAVRTALDVYSTGETDTAISTAIGGLSTVLYSGGATMPYANLAAVQSALGITPISGLTTNYLPKWNGTTFANSSLSEATATKVDLAGRLNFSATNAGGTYTESWIARQGSNYLTINSQDYILVTISAAAGGLGDFRFGAYGLGFGTYASVPFQARSTGEQLRLEYSSGVDARHTVDASGNYIISPTGGRIGVGKNANPSGALSSAFGQGATSSGDLSFAAGINAISSGYGSFSILGNASADYSMAFGYSSASAVANTAVFGAGDSPINTIWAGKGAPHATPTLWSIRGTSGLGSNITGGDIAVDAGAGTGTNVGATGRLRATSALASGTTLQTTWVDALTWTSAGVTGLLANGFTISGTELGYLDGATSNIQAQIDALAGGGGLDYVETLYGSTTSGTDVSLDTSAALSAGTYLCRFALMDQGTGSKVGYKINAGSTVWASTPGGTTNRVGGHYISMEITVSASDTINLRGMNNAAQEMVGSCEIWGPI